tara:strand:- start:1175 stop:2563 length:1389 start_codon:yes stop_codon:yes gene_type:complete
MLNPFFTQGTSNEQNLVQELVDEHIRMHGIEFVYMPRLYVNKKTIMREVTSSSFEKAFPLEGYIENYQGFGDNHNLLTKFGVRSTAEMNIVISQRRFMEYITPILQDGGGVGLDESPVRPLEGDVIFFPLANILFEVKYVEHESNFYQLQENYTYTLKCEPFEYEDEKIITGIPEIDREIETLGYNATLTLVGVGTDATAVTSLVNGGIHVIRILNEGTGFTADPSIRISPPVNGRVAQAVAITTENGLGSRSLQEIRITDPGFGYTSLPSVKFETEDGKGSNVAVQVGIATTGAVGIITLTNQGTDYVLPPNITFSDPPAGGVTAIGTALLQGDGKVAQIQVTNAGHGYTTAPTITVGSAGTVGVGTFFYGDMIRGVSTGTTAYATSWNKPTGKLTANNLTGRFGIGELIVGTARSTGETVAYRLNSINYDDDDAFETNQEIESAADEILDFTEQNPFGEV